MKLRSRVVRTLPSPIRYRAVAAGYRLRGEQRLMLLDDFVPRRGTAVDAGAWWGPWTYWLSRRCDQVWSFEPNPLMAAHLAAVAAPNVHVEHVALSDADGTAQLHTPEAPGPDALGTLDPRFCADGSRAVEVQLRTLDSYGLEDVSFVKIDVENHEMPMLEGSRKTLERWQPSILIEIEQRFYDFPITEVFAWLGALDYAGWLRRQGRWEPVTTFDVQRDQHDHVAHVHSPAYINNFVFLPAGAEPGRP